SALELRRMKRMGFSDRQLGELRGTTEAAIRELRWRLDVHPAYKTVDTCAGEFPSATPYLYSSYDAENESTPFGGEGVVILGSGPNRIGQGVEFDYCCVRAGLAERETCPHAAVVELDALPDAVRPTAEDYDALAAERRRFVLSVVRAVEVGRGGGEFPGARVDGLVRGMHIEPPTQLADGRLCSAAQLAQLSVREAHALHAPQLERTRLVQPREPALRFDQLFHLIEEPGIDPRCPRHVVHRHAVEQRALDLEDPLGRGGAQRHPQVFRAVAGQAVVRQGLARHPSRAPDLQGAQALLERFLEGAPDRHRLAHGFHLGGETEVRGRKLLERKPRHLHH